jgi:hypothetical protein
MYCSGTGGGREAERGRFLPVEKPRRCHDPLQDKVHTGYTKINLSTVSDGDPDLESDPDPDP